jgi:hypothetical protein
MERGSIVESNTPRFGLMNILGYTHFVNLEMHHLNDAKV